MLNTTFSSYLKICFILFYSSIETEPGRVGFAQLLVCCLFAKKDLHLSVKAEQPRLKNEANGEPAVPRTAT